MKDSLLQTPAGDDAADRPRSSPQSPLARAARRTAARESPMRRSLAASTGEGVAAEVVQACAGPAMATAWALHLHAGPLLLGVLWALPFFGQLLQLPAAWLMAHFNRRRVAIAGNAIARQVLILLAVLPFLPVSIASRRTGLVAVISLSSLAAVAGGNAWMSWMGDLVPARIRGRYFGRRTALCAIGGAAASLAAGSALDAATRRGVAGPALSVLALVGWVGAAISTRLMRRQHDPRQSAPSSPAPRDLAEPFTHSPSRRILLYQAAWNVALGLTASLTAVYMLKTLHIGFTGMAIYAAVLAGARVLATPLWGLVLDRVGARPVLVVCSVGSALISALWMLAAPGRLWPIAIDAVLSGVLLGGQGLAAFAIPLAVAPRTSRTMLLSAFVMAGGLAFGLGSIAGGAIVGALPALVPALGARALFAASAVGRLAAAVLAQRILEPGAQPVAQIGHLAARKWRSWRALSAPAG
jgi:MFS family permease